MEPTPPLVSWLSTLADLVRLRLCRLLEREELTVGELARVMQLPQSTVSRHLKVLHSGGWLTKRTEGTASLYALQSAALPEDAAALWALVRGGLRPNATFEQDDHRLAEVLAERSTDSLGAFFGKIAGAWDHLRAELFGSGFTAEALLHLLPEGLVMADLGCGTGNASGLLAPLVARVFAIDREPAMLEAARQRLAAAGNVEFCLGDITALPLEDGSIDIAVTMLVLHHLEMPQRAVAEMARILRPGGRALIVDMVRHDRESFRYQMGHCHPGFADDQIDRWAAETGLTLLSLRRLRPDTTARGPDLFAAVMSR